MIRKALTAAGIALGLALAAAPLAQAFPADDPYGWNTYQDKTVNFTTPLDPGAFAAGNPKAIVLSPYGTSRTIECKGDGHYAQIACRQFDGAGVAHVIQPVVIGPFRTFWVYNPLPS